MTFSSTVKRSNSPTPCSVRAIPSSARRSGLIRASDCPRQCSDPDSARTKPQIRLNRVVFPAPLGPITPTTSPEPDLERHAVERGDPAEADRRIAHGQAGGGLASTRASYTSARARDKPDAKCAPAAPLSRGDRRARQDRGLAVGVRDRQAQVKTLYPVAPDAVLEVETFLQTPCSDLTMSPARGACAA